MPSELVDDQWNKRASSRQFHTSPDAEPWKWQRRSGTSPWSRRPLRNKRKQLRTINQLKKPYRALTTSRPKDTVLIPKKLNTEEILRTLKSTQDQRKNVWNTYIEYFGLNKLSTASTVLSLKKRFIVKMRDIKYKIRRKPEHVWREARGFVVWKWV